MYVLEWRIVSALTRWLFWCLFSELRSNEGNGHQNTTPVSAETVRHASTYIILFLTRHTESINDDKTTIFTHRRRVSLVRFSSWWWRHNRLLMMSQWPDSCDAITWIMISSSINIDFIHGDIHGRSFKDVYFQKHFIHKLRLCKSLYISNKIISFKLLDFLLHLFVVWIVVK